MTLTKEQFQSIIRTVMNVAGGALVTSGTLSSSNLETITGIALPLAMAVWGLFVHTPENTLRRADAIKAKLNA